MTALRLYGASYSVYTRIARLVLAECMLSYDFVELDIFDKENLPRDDLERHPFSKIPVLEQSAFRLCETDAIAQYLVALAGRERLLPSDPRARARCLQLMRICDNYAYPKLVWGVYVEEQEKGAISAEAREEARGVLAVLENFVQAPFFIGENLSLADLWAVPVITCFSFAPSAPKLLADCPKLEKWLGKMAQRASVQATRFPQEASL